MTPEAFAALIDGRTESRARLLRPDEQKLAAERGLVVAFGASDDLLELEGAVRDEVGGYGGGEALLTQDGLLERKCEDSDCPHEEARAERATKIESLWCAEGDLTWTFSCPIEHATFVILNDDGEPWCRGIVFRLADCAA